MKYVISLSVLVCIVLFSCKSQDGTQKPSKKPETQVVGTKWVLTKLNGDLVNLSSPELEQPFIQLTNADNSISGNGGCNSFGGTFVLKEKKHIELSQIMSTMRHCEDGGIENVFLGNLKKTASYLLKKDELTLKDENGYELATFEPAVEKM